MILETKAKAIEKALGDGGILANIPWEMIMEFLMTIFAGGSCFPTSQSLVDSQRMGPAKKAALGVWIRREFGIRGMRKVNDVRQVMLAELESTNETELVQAWEEARQEVTPDLTVM